MAALFSLNVDLTSLLSQVFFSISTVGTIAILDYMSSTNIYIYMYIK